MELEKRDQLVILFEKYQNFLTQSQKQALHLYLIEDLSASEIAKIIASSRQAAHDAIKKAIHKLEDIEKKIAFK